MLIVSKRHTFKKEKKEKEKKNHLFHHPATTVKNLGANSFPYFSMWTYMCLHVFFQMEVLCMFFSTCLFSLIHTEHFAAKTVPDWVEKGWSQTGKWREGSEDTRTGPEASHHHSAPPCHRLLCREGCASWDGRLQCCLSEKKKGNLLSGNPGCTTTGSKREHVQRGICLPTVYFQPAWKYLNPLSGRYEAEFWVTRCYNHLKGNVCLF